MPRIILMVTLRDCYKCISPMQSVINVFIFRAHESPQDDNLGDDEANDKTDRGKNQRSYRV